MNSLKMNFSTFLSVLLIIVAANADKIIQTRNGPVRGVTLSSGKIEAFLGIPYAEPPVGHLRFKKPVSKASWEDVYDANQKPISCIQGNIFPDNVVEKNPQSEDCLYLNLWVPKLHEGAELMPIIVFIHGGGFMIGSSSQEIYDGLKLAEHGNVIVASINYRLGGLGFFTGLTDDLPGNLGMHDQVAAIRWIKENAEVFQGDPENIVLMGGSAGSMSISAHLLSPLSRNIFRRAILLSGSVLHPLYSDKNENLLKLCQRYASIIGCTPNGETLDDNAKSITECIKNLPFEKFQQADTILLKDAEDAPGDLFSIMLHPRVGDDFLPENTIDSFRKGNFKDTEVLFGITRDEGSLLLTFFSPTFFGSFGEKDVTPFFNETSTRQYIRNSVSEALSDESEDEKIIQSYLDNINEEEKYAYVKVLSDAYGDYIISCGAVFQAEIQSLKDNPVYFYMFDYKSPSSTFSKWMGVPHAEDIHYVFGNPFFHDLSDLDNEVSEDLMDRLVAFAKTGNPNVPKAVTWPRYTFEDQKYLAIGRKESVETKPDRNRCEVWRKKFRSVIDDELIQSLKNRNN